MEPQVSPSTTIRWEGKHTFFISGTEYQDDTLHILANWADTKGLLTLTLPTLCITYADMAFANAVGGRQDDYPDSASYGAAHFDPPVRLVGDHQIRKFTWIRGAEDVTIGPEKTVIRWTPRDRLVIPKLRISVAKPVKTMLTVPEVFIPVDRPLSIDVMQFANGRHVGGVEVFKSHPDWKPDDNEQFDLWVAILDEKTQRPIAQAHVTLHVWSEDEERYLADKEWYTDKDGIVRATDLKCSKMMLMVEEPRYQPQAWAFRAFAGQTVKRVFQMTAR